MRLIQQHTVLLCLLLEMIAMQGRRVLVTCFSASSRRVCGGCISKKGLQHNQWITRRRRHFNVLTSTATPIEICQDSNSTSSTKRTFSVVSTTTDPTTESGERDWREDPLINPTILFPTWIVPSKHCQAILKDEEFQLALASSFHDLQFVHPRIKVVQSNSEEGCVLILRNPSIEHSDSDEIRDRLDEMGIREGPVFEMSIPYSRWTWQYLLEKLLPPEVHPPPNSYEQVGPLIHLNLKSHHLPFQKLIGSVLFESLRPQGIETIVNKVGNVSGPHRTFDMEVLAGTMPENLVLTEHGIKIQLDISKVYWNTRLSGERLYMVQNEFMPKQLVADVFCGVGALCLLAVKRMDCSIWANDWNPYAVEYLKKNIESNSLGKKNRFKVSCSDSYDFLIDIGLLQNEQEQQNQQLPHHVVMNYPLEAPKFLSALRWWPARRGNNEVVPKFHVYTFARATKDRSSANVAIDLVAHYLLPQGREPTPNRKEELNELGCKVHAREIRDVAPGKLVLCVTFLATPTLIRHMQGEYV